MRTITAASFDNGLNGPVLGTTRVIALRFGFGRPIPWGRWRDAAHFETMVYPSSVLGLAKRDVPSSKAGA